MSIIANDFPSTYREFVLKFHDNQACAAYLEHLSWPDGFFAPIVK